MTYGNAHTSLAGPTRRVYYIDPEGFGPCRAWFDQFWDQALASFQNEIEHTKPTEGGNDLLFPIEENVKKPRRGEQLNLEELHKGERLFPAWQYARAQSDAFLQAMEARRGQ